MRPQILLDANLILLLLIGTFDPQLIPSFKRVSSFTPADFELLYVYCSAHQIVTTPHVLTEASNLGTALPQKTREAWLRHFALFAAQFEEVHTPFVKLAESPIFSLFGLTDAAISTLRQEVTLITEDGRLRSYLARAGVQAYGLNDIRQAQRNAAARFN